MIGDHWSLLFHINFNIVVLSHYYYFWGSLIVNLWLFDNKLSQISLRLLFLKSDNLKWDPFCLQVEFEVILEN